MADNVEITAGSGTPVSTEDVTTLNGGAVTSQHVQRVAIASRTADATAVDLIGDTANGLDVDVTRSALPSGASTSANQDTANTSLAAVEASLSVLDDWDETNRAAVNLIASQVAITGGAGTVAANSPRVTLASNDPAVTALEVIDNFISGSRGLVTEDSAAAIKTAVELIDNCISGSRALVTEDNSAAIKTALEIIDDWDETNRAAVNVIAGQVGVAGGSGTVSALTQRVVLATDVGLPAGTSNIGVSGNQRTYGSKTTITWTGTSLANGSARASTVIDNTTNRYADVRIRIQTKGQTSGSNYIDWYVYTALGDTTYTDGATGSDAAFTAANRFNSRYLGSTKLNAGTSAVQSEYQMSDIFVTCPDKWGLIGINNSGAALSATAGDHVLEYQGIN